MQSFTAQVSDWVNQTKARRESVFKGATETLFFDVLTPRPAGNMRVVTGFLRASASVTLNNPNLTLVNNPDPKGVFPFQSGPIALTIAGADETDTIFMTFTANYARPREYGARGQAPDAFVATNVVRWQDIVTASALKLRGRADSAAGLG